MPKILVVEDQHHNMRLIEQILEDIDENLDITKAFSGSEAIAKAQESPFHLVLMDISLPDLDGFQATEIMKKIPDLQNTPFVAVTAHVMLQEQEAFWKLFDDYISKPLDEERLAEIVNKWVGEA